MRKVIVKCYRIIRIWRLWISPFLCRVKGGIWQNYCTITEIRHTSHHHKPTHPNTVAWQRRFPWAIQIIRAHGNQSRPEGIWKQPECVRWTVISPFSTPAYTLLSPTNVTRNGCKSNQSSGFTCVLGPWAIQHVTHTHTPHQQHTWPCTPRLNAQQITFLCLPPSLPPLSNIYLL